MKLPCYVEVMNNSGKSRAAQAVVTLCSHANSVRLTVSFLNKPDKIFHVRFLHKVYEKFVSSGKAGIHFRDGSNYLLISKADPEQLKNFIDLLKNVAGGKALPARCLSGSKVPVRTKDFESLKKSMIVSKRGDYPFTSNMPPGLELFQANNCRLKRFDTRILCLKSLKYLDLSNNKLAEDLKRVKLDCLENLKELKLASNNIVALTPEFWTSLPRGLIGLWLNNNLLGGVPPCLFSLSLVKLDLSHNFISELPEDIMNLRYSLRYLNLGFNSFRLFYYGLFRLKLEYLDIRGNNLDFLSREDEFVSYVPSLQHSAAKALKDAKRGIPKYYPRASHEALAACRPCDTCGTSCTPGRTTKVYDSRMKMLYFSSMHLDEPASFSVPCYGYCCSARCAEQFHIRVSSTSY